MSSMNVAQAQAQDLEVQACQAVSHLHQLQARQLQLTARNSLLETVINSNFDFDPDEVGHLPLHWVPLLVPCTERCHHHCAMRLLIHLLCLAWAAIV